MILAAETLQSAHNAEAAFYQVLGSDILEASKRLETQAYQGWWQDVMVSDTDEGVVAFPKVMVVAEMPAEAEVYTKAERLIQRAGSLAIRGEVSLSSDSQEAGNGYTSSLLQAAKRARIGDRTARKVVDTNVLTDVIERSIKAGHVLSVNLEVNDAGKIMQHGQLMDDVHVNALRYASEMPQMRERAEAETRNGVRIEQCQQLGLLKDYCFVVFSRYPDNMTDNEAGKVGFFTETQSCAIQVTTLHNSHLVTESAFVAGVKKPNALPHDAHVITALAAQFGHDLSGKNTTEIIDSPILIHKSLLKHGVLDLVRRYDDIAGNTFFGEEKPQQDYEAYAKVCREREANLSSIVLHIADRLIADSESMNHPLEATRRLHVLSQQQMVDFAISNGYINPRVFGTTAAAHIEDARFWLERGQHDRFMMSRDMAQNTARSSSCPTSEQTGDGDPKDGDNEGRRPEAEPTAEKKMMNCPYCGAKVWGDPCARVLRCWDCNALAKDGKEVSRGDGGHKARAARAAAESAARVAKQEAELAKQVDAVFREAGEKNTDEQPQNDGGTAKAGTSTPVLVGVL